MDKIFFSQLFREEKKCLKFKVGLSNPLAQTDRANSKTTQSEACDSWWRVPTSKNQLAGIGFCLVGWWESVELLLQNLTPTNPTDFHQPKAVVLHCMKLY